jgi:hypothetical protein
MVAVETQTEPKYRTVAQLAIHFGVSKSTIYRGVAQGWPHSRIGGLKFSDPDVAEIEQRIRELSTPAPEPKYSPKQLAKAAERLGLPAPRRGS